MGIVLILLFVIGFAAACLIGLSGAASLVSAFGLLEPRPHTPARKRTRDRVLLVLLALFIVGHALHFLGLI